MEKPKIKYRPGPFDQAESIEVVQYHLSDGQKNPPNIVGGRSFSQEVMRKTYFLAAVSTALAAVSTALAAVSTALAAVSTALVVVSAAGASVLASLLQAAKVADTASTKNNFFILLAFKIF